MVQSGLDGCHLPRRPAPPQSPAFFTRARLLPSFNFLLTSFTPPSRSPPPAHRPFRPRVPAPRRASLRSARNLPEKEFASLTAILGRVAPPQPPAKGLAPP